MMHLHDARPRRPTASSWPPAGHDQQQDDFLQRQQQEDQNHPSPAHDGDISPSLLLSPQNSAFTLDNFPPPTSTPPNMPLPPVPTATTRRPTPRTMVKPATNPVTTTTTTLTSLPPTPKRSASASAASTREPSVAVTPLRKLSANNAVAASGLPALLKDAPSSPPTSPTGTGLSSATVSPASRTFSIGAFPRPPTGFGAKTSPVSMSPVTSSSKLSRILPPSTGSSPKAITPPTPIAGSKRKSSDSQQRSSPRTSVLPAPIHGKRTTSLAYRAKRPERLLDLPSPPDSRPASANASPLTENTAFEDVVTPLSTPRIRSRHSAGSAGRTVRTRQSNASLRDAKGNVTVSVRIRPSPNTASAHVTDDWAVDGKSSTVSHIKGDGTEYRYDNVFTANDDNTKVYDASAKRLVRRVMEGYHGTVFAYGITGTGKTFSMQGTAQSPGMIPLAITDIFSYIREHPTREFLLRVSYLEIYNERIYDLLSSASSQSDEIKLREDSKRGVYATPLKEEIVQSPTQLLRVIARGDTARRTGSTQFNARSSRSHAVVQIVVESRERVLNEGEAASRLPGGVLVSTLSLIDLAGSERAAEDKERRTEGSHINKSLLTLGTVISRLAGDKDAKSDKAVSRKHLPYRDSKLTRLLQSALSGNALISILCTVQLSQPVTVSGAVAAAGQSDTLNTLVFASRAKNNIVSDAKKNEAIPAHGGDAHALLDRYRQEIETLRHQLEEQNQLKLETNRTEEEEERWLEREREAAERHEEQMLEMHLARTALKERISHLNRLILSSKSAGVNTTSSIPMRIRDKRAPPPDGVGLALGSPETSRNSSVGSNGTGEKRPVYKVSASPAILAKSPTSDLSSPRIAQSSSIGEDAEDEVLAASGDVTPVKQLHSLQADLADRNRYIASLEKRLLETKRASLKRASIYGSSQKDHSADEDAEEKRLNAIKDREIADLKARVDDQARMLEVLREAVRKRDTLTETTAYVKHSRPSLPPLMTESGAKSQAVRRVQSSGTIGVGMSTSPATTAATAHHTRVSTSSSTGSRSINFSRLTPVTTASSSFAKLDGLDEGKIMGSPNSYEEMSRLLEDLMQRSGKATAAGPGMGGSDFDFAQPGWRACELPAPAPLLVAEFR